LDFLEALTREDIDWRRVDMFHLDEYVGLAANHPASFRKYLLEHLVNKTAITQYHFLDGNGDFKKCVRESQQPCARRRWMLPLWDRRERSPGV